MKLIIVKIFLVAVVLTSNTLGVRSNIVVMPEAMYSNSNPAAKVENYVLQHQRQFEDHIKDLDNQLENMRNNFNMRLDVVEFYNVVVDVKLGELQNKLDPMEMLGDVNDYCVEKYRGKIPAEGTIKETLKTCINKAKTAFTPLLTSPENTLKNIKNHYNNQFTNAMKECKRKFSKDETKYQNCAATGIKTTSNYFTTNTNTFLTQMTTVDCNANTKIDEAFDCYSTNVYQTFTSIGEVTGLVENCVAGHEFCPPCENEDLNVTKGRCPYQMAWHLADDDLTGDKIVNPFKGINSTTPCLQVNFITKNFNVKLN
ncbi:uncharacterized protein isoform X1 [Musca autumnalis]|uniref:uncharacterized protein isoform X1 n=1 Tax=Musca autumnalis TaxID=221902 RepID=UPI003CF0EA93